MSALEPIQPLSRRGLEPAETGELPELRFLPLSALRINRRYQREVAERGAALVRKVVTGFDWARFKALNVLDLGDGTYEVLDGQHSAVAVATHGGLDAVPCLVAPDRPAAEKAAAFVGLNRDRVTMTPLQVFWAELESGDEIAGAVREGVEAAGARVLRRMPSGGRYEVGDTIAAAALKAVAKRKGKAGVKRLCAMGVEARLTPVSTQFIKAAEALLWRREYEGEVADAAIVAAVVRKGWDALVRAADARRKELGIPAYLAMAQLIYQEAERATPAERTALSRSPLPRPKRANLPATEAPPRKDRPTQAAVVDPAPATAPEDLRADLIETLETIQASDLREMSEAELVDAVGVSAFLMGLRCKELARDGYIEDADGYWALTDDGRGALEAVGQA